MGRLVTQVWPEPDLGEVKMLRRMGLKRAPSSVTVAPGVSADVSEWGQVSVKYHGHLILEQDEQNCIGFWPPLPDVEFAWRAASMLTAARASIEEELLIPVAYKAMWLGWGGVYSPDGRTWVWPSRFMGPAQCDTISPRHSGPAPVIECECGFHAAFSVSELATEYRDAGGVLVVTPVGKTVWHDNAWRAEGYQVHAAVVPLDWEVPDSWDPEVPVIRARTPLIPYRAYEIAREVRAMVSLEEQEAHA